jgi:hypothetical protein
MGARSSAKTNFGSYLNILICSEELNLKNASFVVLDSRYRSLLQERDQHATQVKVGFLALKLLI